MKQQKFPAWPLKPPKKSSRKKTKLKQKEVDKAVENIINGHGIVTTEALESIGSEEIKSIVTEDDSAIFKPSPGPQTDFLAAPEREVLYGGAKGGGKGLLLNDILPTTKGMCTVGKIKAGDFVFAEDGTPTRVLIAHEPFMAKQAYAVEFETGEIIVVNDAHLWSVYDYHDRQKLHKKKIVKEQVLNTECMSKSVYFKYANSKALNYSVENVEPIQYAENNLEIPPYTFGCWLGDGTSTASVIGMAKEDMLECLQYMQQEGTIFASVKEINKKGKSPMLSVKFGNRKILRSLGVYDDKFIPEKYLTSSFVQRLSLLQGILDTDGSCRKEKGQIELTFKSKKLMEDTFKLVCSLGIKTKINTKIATCQNGYTCEVYRITFYSKLPCFKLKRKLQYQKLNNFRPTVGRRFIVDIRPVEKQMMRCLTVEHPSGTFVVGNSFIKTHNSYALMIDPLRYMGCKHARALIIRRSTPDLRDMINKAQQIYDKAYPGTKWVPQQNLFRFPSGASIEFTYCESASDLPRFQGINMTYCGLDEAALHPYLPELLNYIRSNIRTVDPVNAPPMLRMTANPGEVMSNYLKEEFVDRAEPNTTFWNSINVFDPRNKTTRVVNISKKYIPATVFDNPYLLQDDSYLATLAALPEVKRKQWLMGDWGVSENSAFPEFDRDVHVVAPFEIPHSWKRLRSMDWGFTQPGVVLWGAVSPSGQLFIYREYKFQKKDALVVSQEGRSMELGEPKMLGIADASVWQNRGTLGENIGELLQRHWPSWVPSSRARINNTSSRAHRKNLIHQYLSIDPTTGLPRMVFFPNCRNVIESMASIPIDKSQPECFDTESKYDHAADSLSYMLQGRPSNLKGWTDPFDRLPTEKRYEVQDAIFGY